MINNTGMCFSEHNRYHLEINDSAVTADVLCFRGREALSEPFHWETDFTTGQGNIRPEQLLLKYASLRMCAGRTVHGIITRMEWLGTSADQSHYRITLSSRLSLLSHSRRCAVYQNQSVAEVTEQVLRAHGLEGADFEFRLERRYPRRELITQWRETDLEFIQRILSETGIYWRTEMDDSRGLDVVIFGDSQLNYVHDGQRCGGRVFNARLAYSESAGLHDGREQSVWDVRTWHGVVTGMVSTRSGNERAALTPADAAVRVRSDRVSTGEHYRYSEPAYAEAGDDSDPEPETESGAFYARLCHERELNDAVRIHLFSNAANLSPGQVVQPQGRVIRDLKEGIIITLATFRAARDSRLHVSLWGMPYSESYCYRPGEIRRPQIHGTLVARIESGQENDIYARPDTDGRYRVRLDFDRSDTQAGYAYLRLRLAKPYAGDTYGWHMPLTDGTEVAVAYSDGDADRPYIAYALHDSAHPDPVSGDSRSGNILRTPANNILDMEDRRGEEHIKLAAEYGKTQLNLGHLTDGQKQRRGGGFELRTDEQGVIRVAGGLFISADGQAGAQGEVTDTETALKETDICLQQIQQLTRAAEQAKVLEAGIHSRINEFNRRLKLLHKTIHFSAPQGVVFTSGEGMQLAAGRNVTFSAAGDMSMGVTGSLTMLAGEKAGLFARSGQLSLKSGEGAVEIQAQKGALRLYAEKKLVISAEQNILFAGKKSITLIGGGSYLKLEQGKIEYGTPGTYVRRVKRTAKMAAESMGVQAITGGGLCLSCLMEAAINGDTFIIRGES